MALALPLPGGVITQRFGLSSMAVQPTMFLRYTEKAYWVAFPGYTDVSDNVHAGVDFAGMPAGSRLVAPEDATIVRAEYDRYNGGGWVIEGEIRPGVRWSLNHCQSLAKWVGAKVTKGQTVAYVGATGTIWDPERATFVRSTYGVHCHTLLIVRETGPDGITRTMLHDFLDFASGGSRAGSSLVRPPSDPVYPNVVVNPTGVNIRTTPDLDVGDANIMFVARADGIRTRAGTKVAGPSYEFDLRRTVVTDDGEFGELLGLKRTLYVRTGLYHRA
jgi:murein DD-endopeptidase MepM/ murein hydrolase activator NlpD